MIRRADIGGSLIKLVYFSPDTEVCPVTGTELRDGSKTGGRLHFVKVRPSRLPLQTPCPEDLHTLVARSPQFHPTAAPAPALTPTV